MDGVAADLQDNEYWVTGRKSTKLDKGPFTIDDLAGRVNCNKYPTTYNCNQKQNW